MQKVNKDMDFYSKAVERATGIHKEEAGAEIQAVYLDVMRKTDDLVAMQRENIANLVMKQKVSDHIQQKILEKAYERATESGNEEEILLAENALLQYTMDTKEDYKIFKAVNEGIKTLKGLEPKVVTINTQNDDDALVFDITEGAYE